MAEWINELKNADGILPDGDFRWWQCSQCFHQGRHSGYHYRDMLREPVEVDGTLAFVLRDLAIEKGIEEMNAFNGHLHNIWLSIDEKNPDFENSDFETWVGYYVKPWHMIKAACLILKSI